ESEITAPVVIVGPQDGLDPRPVASSTRTATDPLTEAISTCTGSTALVIRSGDVEIRGLTFTGASNNLLETNSIGGAADLMANVVISYNIFTAGGDDGLNLEELEGGLIDHNYIYAFAALGIKVRDDSQGIIVSNN